FVSGLRRRAHCDASHHHAHSGDFEGNAAEGGGTVGSECWERGRPVRIERLSANSSCWIVLQKLSVLRTLCGRDVRAPSLFVPQTLNWVEAGSFARGPDTEDQSHAYAHGDTGCDSPKRN